MPIFNYKSKEMIVKIVYYGPGLCGKTTSLQALHQRAIPERKGELYFLATEADQTIYFELLPLYAGEMKGFKLRFQVYTVPGQVKYNNTRRIVLQGVDALVFVADSQRERREANIVSFKNLNYNLMDGYNLNLEDLPLVYEYNKRDLPEILTLDELSHDVNPHQLPYFETVAIEGNGVLEAFELISSLAIENLEKRVERLAGGKVPRPGSKESQQPRAQAPTFFVDKDTQIESLEMSMPSDYDSTYDPDILIFPEAKEDIGISYAGILPETYKNGEIIFDEGDAGNKMYVIEKGKIKIIGPSNKVLITYKEGDFFGEIVVFSGTTRSAKAVAVGKTSLIPLTEETLVSQTLKKPEISIALLKTLSKRLRGNTQTINKLVAQNQELRKHVKKSLDLLEQAVKQNKLLRQKLGLTKS